MAAGRRWLLGAALVRCGVREARRLWLGPVERVVVGHGGSAGLLTVFLNSFSLKKYSKTLYNTYKQKKQSAIFHAEVFAWDERERFDERWGIYNGDGKMCFTKHRFRTMWW